MAPTTASARVLNLVTFERQILTIDGQEYEIRAPDEFSVFDYADFSARWERIGALMKIAQRTDDEEETYRKELADLTARILDAPASVRAKLKPGHQVQIALVFSQRLTPMTTEPTGAPVTPTRMKASRKRGSTSRRA